MMRVVSIIAAAASLVWFSWQVSVVLLILVAWYEPLAAAGLGLLADVLYYEQGAYAFPYFTLFGVAVAVAAVFVRKFIQARIIH